MGEDAVLREVVTNSWEVVRGLNAANMGAQNFGVGGMSLKGNEEARASR